MLYIWRKTGSGTKELEKEIQTLKEENQKLQQQLDQQFIKSVVEKTENKQ